MVNFSHHIKENWLAVREAGTISELYVQFLILQEAYSEARDRFTTLPSSCVNTEQEGV